MNEPPDYEEQTDDESDVELDARQFSSLDRALTGKGIPLENHLLIRQFTSAIGIAAYYGRSGYIKAVRPGDGPDLRIHSGYTNGFASEAEVRAAVGPTAHCWPSRRGTGQWGVDHPVHGTAGGGGKKSGNPRLDYGTCPSCRQYPLLPTGRCSVACDE